MPIPSLTKDGLLPPGVHDCTLQEIGAMFGTFRSSDRRPRLFASLIAFMAEAGKAGLFVEALVDGSFVTAKPDPGDIDILLVFAPEHDFQADLLPHQYNLVFPLPSRRHWGFDVMVAGFGTAAYVEAVALFQRVRNHPDKLKGILRIEL